MTDEVAEVLEKAGAFVMEPRTLDDAILGYHIPETGHAVALYDYHLLLDAFRKEAEDPDSEEAIFEAEEWISYNVVRALPYLGDKAPWIIVDVLDGEPEEDEDTYFTWEGKRWRKL
jgi:hypothetical protein